MKLNPKFLTHETKGEHITVSTTGTKFNGLIRSNPTAAFIVESLKNDTTESEIVDKMLASDRQTMGEKGYQFLKENYLVEHTYKAIMKHFAQLIENN